MKLEDEALRGQLARILASKTLSTSEAQRRLLQYLSEKSLAGEAEFDHQLWAAL